MMTERTPTTILSGFLGSGKTTLLNWVLKADHGYRVAVIVNEFGQVGIDGARIMGASQFVELDNGCLCCAINDDLQKTLADLKKDTTFDHLIIETTGLADPLPVAWTLTKPGLSEQYSIETILTVVDAFNLERALKTSQEAELQIERADLLILNKVDLVEEDLPQVEEMIETINAHAPIIKSAYGEIDYSFVFNPSHHKGKELRVNEGGTSHHHTVFDAWTFQTKDVFDEGLLEDLLYALPDNIYRVKGIVELDSEMGWTDINAVAGRIELRPRSEQVRQQGGALVFIGRELNTEQLNKLCNAALASRVN
tara:strand:+ start:500 stop:1429 length:930 start_codon:yes stop_codon:yes gene_type:complete